MEYFKKFLFEPIKEPEFIRLFINEISYYLMPIFILTIVIIVIIIFSTKERTK